MRWALIMILAGACATKPPAEPVRGVVAPSAKPATKPKMIRPDRSTVVNAYLKNSASARGAHDLKRAVEEQPQRAWHLILALINTGPPEHDAIDVSWDLMQLLRLHGPTVIADVEQAERANPAVRHVVRAMRVEQERRPGAFRIPAEIWNRVNALADGETAVGTTPISPDLSADDQAVVRATIVHEDSFWAWEYVDASVDKDPREAWPLILSIVNAAPSDDDLAALGAGPLEDILCKHGQSVIETIEAEAASNAKLRFALAGVWRSTMSEAIWNRVTVALGSQQRY
jgi:hypothetical protein